ncbi:LysR family transcriptional regulator [soil metagenome]
MDLARLKLFVRVAECGSLSKAAVALDSMQSAISRQIAVLERECGHRLFDRTGRGVTLTSFGERLFPRIKALVDEADQVENAMKGAEELPEGEVRIGFMPSVAELFVATFFKRVRESYPGIRLRIFEGSNGQLDEWVSNGRIDMAVLYRYGNSIKRYEDRLFVVDTYLVGAPGDPITSKPTVNFAELDGLPLCLPGTPNGLRVTLDQLARREKSGVTLNIALEADSLPIQRSMACSGEAYAVHGGVVVARDVRAGIVSAARIVNPGIKRTMVIATTTHKPLSVAGRETSKLLRQVCEGASFDARPESHASSEGDHSKP